MTKNIICHYLLLHIFVRIVYNNPIQEYYFLERLILLAAKLLG